jgi:hypothetical protein
LLGCAVAFALFVAPGLAGMIGTAVTGVDDLAPTTAPATTDVAGEGDVAPSSPVWSAPRVIPTRQASRSHRQVARGTGSRLPLVLLAIRHCESHDDYRAENPRSTASGAFQIIDGTWAGYGGYRHASHAPRAVQDRQALALYADRGTQPWRSSRWCWA